MTRPSAPARLSLLVLAAFLSTARAEGLPKYVPTPGDFAAAYGPPGRPDPTRRLFRDRINPTWAPDDSRFWYRNDLRGGAKEFVLVEPTRGALGPAFDHDRLAAGLSKAAKSEFTGDRLPFDEFAYVQMNRAVSFRVGGTGWTCDLDTYECTRSKDAAQPPPAASPDPMPRPFGRRPRGGAPGRSPDGKWTATVRDGNLILRDSEGKDRPLTTDGRPDRGYEQPTWAPDSRTLAAFRVTPGDDKEVFRIESSPKGGGRAVLQQNVYPLPGDKFASHELFLFEITSRNATKAEVDPVDFGRPAVRWAADGKTLTYPKVDRGHQRFRLVEVDAKTGSARNLIDERSNTFIWTAHTESMGMRPVTWLDRTDEVIYSSEKSGWRHLYLIDGKTGREKNAITRGEWVVRGVDRIDEAARQVWFRASGFYPDQDPYFVHHFRVNFDGTGLVPLTAGDGTHSIKMSPGGTHLIDTYSRPDRPPVHELRRAADGKLVRTLGEAEFADPKAGPRDAPEVFAAKGRDGATDIWGLIYRPANFDPSKKYPVIEYIYAGPHSAHVPKGFAVGRRFRHLTDLGFVVVQMDGMGTAYRSKAFHDVCWHNLKDAGFPDRILWHKAAAAKYPWYDATRVGIYGTSAGGQNAAGAVLFHGDFYAAAVASCGCHDNRMDKASWNEQWMGVPVGPHYAASSNIDNAHRLRGKLLLIVGELDSNVPPESTYRFSDALIRAGKDFDFLAVPGMGHSDGGTYGRRRLQDFFVRHLHRVEPPDHNRPATANR